MKPFLHLLIREWLEWRGAITVMAVLYVLALSFSAVMLYRGSDKLLEGRMHLDLSEESHDPWEDDEELEWLTPQGVTAAARSGMILIVWTHLIKGGMTFMNVILLSLAAFYLFDATFKERADNSTFFYRSLPVSDGGVLGAKLLFGTVGFLALSWVMAVGMVLFARLTFPGELAGAMEGGGYSLSQVEFLDLFGDWTTFHLLQLLWLLPVAAYFLLISTVVRSRPLLVGIGIPLVAGLIWDYFAGDGGLFSVIARHVVKPWAALGHEWLGQSAMEKNLVPFLEPGAAIDLFGSFGPYILSLRTLVSLAVAAALAGATLVAYRRNMSVS